MDIDQLVEQWSQISTDGGESLDDPARHEANTTDAIGLYKH